jgi:hypothetical protein
VSELEKEVREALERAGADDLGVPRSRYRREPEPLPDSPGWGPLSFLQPATPWHLVGIGALLWILGRFLGRAVLAEPLALLGIVLLSIGILSLIFLPRAQPKRWRGRLLDLDTSRRARLYRRLYRR